MRRRSIACGVASRRLRSGLELFEPVLGKRARPWRRELRGVTRALGNARDADVQIAFLTEFLAGQPGPVFRPGIERLRLRLEQRRERLQRNVVRAMEGLESGGLLEEMRTALSRIHRQHQGGTEACGEGAVDAISARLAELMSYERFIHQPERVAELHQMRIAAKKLRYTMEIFEPLYGEEFTTALEAVRDLQTALGDLHDCDVWVQSIPQMATEEEERTRIYHGHVRAFSRLRKGMLHLQEERTERLAELRERFIRLWEGLRNAISSSPQCPPKPAPTPRAAPRGAAVTPRSAS
ncbi:MAG: CHAD domain-containing protein [Acidobacteria bacterium]|nr:CHAD domain-containing protein [Acidobacteriota bacterium]